MANDTDRAEWRTRKEFFAGGLKQHEALSSGSSKLRDEMEKRLTEMEGIEEKELILASDERTRADYKR